MASTQSRAEYQKAYRAANAERLRLRAAEYYEANKEKKKEGFKARYRANPEPAKARSKSHRKANPEKTTEQIRNWHRENKERVAEIQREFKDRNRDRIRQENAVYAATHRSVLNAKEARRRAAKAQAVPKWASKEAIVKLYAKAEKLTKTTGVEHHVDHIVPLQSDVVCGLHCESNLRVIPAKENISKRNRLIHQLAIS